MVSLHGLQGLGSRVLGLGITEFSIWACLGLLKYCKVN